SVIRKMVRFPSSEDSIAWSLALISYSTPLLLAVYDGDWKIYMYALSLLNAVGCFFIIALDLAQRHSNIFRKAQ
ncbi:MAG: hypothetical protein ACP5RV_13025, partial [Thiomonas sp.]